MRISDWSSDVCSSDLAGAARGAVGARGKGAAKGVTMPIDATQPYDDQNIFAKILRGEIPSNRVYEDAHALAFHAINRSEEHTSELQSLMRISYDVFCLKKKK